MIHRFLPRGVDHSIAPIFAARALRGFGDGFVAVLLPVYLLTLGLDGIAVGAIATATLLGSALATLAVGAWGHRLTGKVLLLSASLVMVATGLGFAAVSTFWLFLLLAFVGTINPSSGDVSIFLPLEHARLAASSEVASRTDMFARYALIGALCSAIGALASGLPDQMVRMIGATRLDALRGMFALYGLIGIMAWSLYRRLPQTEATSNSKPAPLGPSKAIVIKLAALFSVDSFAGGLVVNSLLALWLFKRFDLSLSAAGTFFFCSGLLGAISQLAAPVLARRIGLVNTMVFTHIPSSFLLLTVSVAPSFEVAALLFLLREGLVEMDVPPRQSYVMAIVQPAERTFASGVTHLVRLGGWAVAPAFAGWLMQVLTLGSPLMIGAALKIAYDLLLWRAFRGMKPPEERE